MTPSLKPPSAEHKQHYSCVAPVLGNRLRAYRLPFILINCAYYNIYVCHEAIPSLVVIILCSKMLPLLSAVSKIDH